MKVLAAYPNCLMYSKIYLWLEPLGLEHDVFKSKDPRKIVRSLKRWAEQSKRRNDTPYQSAMSMLNFYINRAGNNLPKTRKQTLERAKDELREVFGRR
jgi:hypothetical protein